NLCGDLEAAGECIHAANMCVEEIDGLEALAAHFRVEVYAAGSEAALAEDHQHALRGQVQIGRKLVGVPAQEQVAAVGVDRAEHAVQRRVGQFVHHGVAREGGVVGLDIELEIVGEAVRAKEGNHGGSVEVVLVGSRLLGLRLDQELAVEADLL